MIAVGLVVREVVSRKDLARLDAGTKTHFSQEFLELESSSLVIGHLFGFLGNLKAFGLRRTRL